MDFRKPMPRPKIRGRVIDAHTHLFAARHAKDWFEAAEHYGIDAFVTMTPLEEAMVLQRNYGDRLHFIAIPRWQEKSYDDWHRRLEMFYNMGSRIIKFHMAPQTMHMRGWRFDSPGIRKIMRDAYDRGMILMSHVGDPDHLVRQEIRRHSQIRHARGTLRTLGSLPAANTRTSPGWAPIWAETPKTWAGFNTSSTPIPTCIWIAARRDGWFAK